MGAILLVGAPSSVHAQQPSADTLRAGQLQAMAREAVDGGDEERALQLATRAADLDPGPTTWLAQQIRIEILERRGQLDEASEFLERYLALDGLFTEHRAWGHEVAGRISAARVARDADAAALYEALVARRRAGIALAAGGAAAAGIGVGFLVNFHHQGADPAHSGGWQDAGLVLSGVGAGLIVPGLVAALSTLPRARPVTAAILPAPGGLWLVVRW